MIGLYLYLKAAAVVTTNKGLKMDFSEDSKTDDFISGFTQCQC